MHTMTLRIDDELHHRVSAHAARDGKSINAWIAEALEHEDARVRSVEHNALFAQNPDLLAQLDAQDHTRQQQLGDPGQGAA